MILDAGFLIAVDRGDRDARDFLSAAIRRTTPLRTTHPVMAQVWRDGTRQARLAKFLGSVSIHALDDGPTVGALLARSESSDVVDAHLVALAVQTGEPILTGDAVDLEAIVGAIPGPGPEVFSWPG